jgi:hypothetical protein
MDPIVLFTPRFDTPLTSAIVELDHLRRLHLTPTTHPLVFLQLKRLFHTLESVRSARIEGNNTTLAEYLELQQGDEWHDSSNESFKEIQNLEEALTYIDTSGTDRPIDGVFIRELHQLVVKDLHTGKGGEGDACPGRYRAFDVQIKGSQHYPPHFSQVPGLMDELIAFINKVDFPQYDLVKIAQAHHRFVWIHPFGNGNGRTVRLFTYAMLIRAGFRIDIAGRIVNPTAVFCSDRDDYYNCLAQADLGTYEGTERWCSYVLSGLLDEIRKVDQLCNYDYLYKHILVPAIKDAASQGRISPETQSVLLMAVEKKIIMSGDVEHLYATQSKANISRKVRQLVYDRMLMPEKDGGRKYVLCFSNSLIMPSIVKYLALEGFLPRNI